MARRQAARAPRSTATPPPTSPPCARPPTAPPPVPRERSRPVDPDEVDQAVARGADEVLLPMVRTPGRSTAPWTRVADGAASGILVETQDAVPRVGALAPPTAVPGLPRAERPAHRPRVGQPVRPLADGTAERSAPPCAGPFGVAGLTLPGGGRAGGEPRCWRRAGPGWAPSSPSCAGRSPPTWPAAIRSWRCRGRSAASRRCAGPRGTSRSRGGGSSSMP